MPGDDYREASHRIWEEMAAGWEGDRQTVWDDSRRPAWQRRADELGVSNAEFRPSTRTGWISTTRASTASSAAGATC